MIVFGAFARREADTDSDIDILVVRPAEVEEDDDEWSGSLEGWRDAVRRLAANPVEVLEVSADEAATKLGSSGQIWNDIRRDRRLVHGLSCGERRATPIG